MSFASKVRAKYGDPSNVTPLRIEPVEPRAFDGSISPYAARALQEECARVASKGPESHERNHQLFKSTASLSELVAGGELPEELVHEELTNAALSTGLDLVEIQTTMRSGYSTGVKKPRGAPPVEQPPEPTTIRPPSDATEEEGDTPEDRADAVRSYFPIVNWDDLWADTTEEEWIIEPILPARRLVAIYSPPKVGKSLLMLEMAAAVANGTEVLGVTPDRARRVLYVDFENDPKGDIRSRLQAMGYTPATLGNLCYLSFPNLSALDSENGSVELLAALETYACEVVIVDTVSRAVKGEENENDTWLNFYRHTGLKLKQNGISLIRLDHTGKDEQKGQRGGSAKGGDVDAVWRMSTVVKDETYRLDCEMNRMPIAEKSLVLQRVLTPHLRHKVDGEGHMAAVRAKTRELIEFMDSTGMPAETGYDNLSKALESSGISATKNQRKEAVRERKLQRGVTVLEATE